MNLFFRLNFKPFYNLFIALSIFLTNIISCSSPSSPIDDSLDSSINGKTIYYTKNLNFNLKLDLNFDAGYTWKYSISDTNVVRIDSIRYKPKNSDENIVGGITVATFFLYTKKSGESFILLEERRPWESLDIPPIETISFTVIVVK